MDAIKNYLESMFGRLPNTPEVRKAKTVLGEMMEDKYTELIEAGKSENEAVGTVISEFGNLDELAEELGITEVMEVEHIEEVRKVSLEEVKDYLTAKSRQSILTGVGVMLCILCIVPFFFTGVFCTISYGTLSVAMMFIMIAIAVALFVLGGVSISRWKYFSVEPCSIDYETAQYVGDKKDSFHMTYAIMMTIGISLCVICVIPVMLSSNLYFDSIILAEGIGLTGMFAMIAVGVFLIVSACMKKSGFSKVLQINPQKTVGGNYVANQNKEVFQNQKLASIMSLYWPTVTCLYLCWSFLTYDWHITWIIWVIAALVKRIIVVFDQK